MKKTLTAAFSTERETSTGRIPTLVRDHPFTVFRDKVETVLGLEEIVRFALAVLKLGIKLLTAGIRNRDSALLPQTVQVLRIILCCLTVISVYQLSVWNAIL